MPNVELTETELEKKYHGILEILLIDRTSNKNIIWATSNYSRFGKGFMSTDHMPLKYLINHSRQIVKPRILKSKTEQKKKSLVCIMLTHGSINTNKIIIYLVINFCSF